MVTSWTCLDRWCRRHALCARPYPGWADARDHPDNGSVPLYPGECRRGTLSCDLYLPFHLLWARDPIPPVLVRTDACRTHQCVLWRYLTGVDLEYEQRISTPALEWSFSTTKYQKSFAKILLLHYKSQHIGNITFVGASKFFHTKQVLELC